MRAYRDWWNWSAPVPVERRPGWVTAALLAAVAAMGWADYLAGPRVSLVLFQVGPLMAAGWYAGRRAALAGAVVAAVIAFSNDRLESSNHETGSELWNAFSRLVIFALVGTLAAQVRSERNRLLDAQRRLARSFAEEAHDARTDPLTGLANRRAFVERLNHLMERGQCLGLELVDLDGFKAVNDHLGHEVGDRLLQQVAATLVRGSHEGSLVARLGGDEFALLLPGATDDELAAHSARTVQALSGPWDCCPSLKVGGSLGALAIHGPVLGPSEALRRADQAMYAAKRAGKGCYRLVLE